MEPWRGRPVSVPDGGDDDPNAIEHETLPQHGYQGRSFRASDASFAGVDASERSAAPLRQMDEAHAALRRQPASTTRCCSHGVYRGHPTQLMLALPSRGTSWCAMAGRTIYEGAHEMSGVAEPRSSWWSAASTGGESPSPDLSACTIRSDAQAPALWRRSSASQLIGGNVAHLPHLPATTYRIPPENAAHPGRSAARILVADRTGRK
jgi:hypothetical protein